MSQPCLSSSSAVLSSTSSSFRALFHPVHLFLFLMLPLSTSAKALQAAQEAPAASIAVRCLAASLKTSCQSVSRRLVGCNVTSSGKPSSHILGLKNLATLGVKIGAAPLLPGRVQCSALPLPQRAASEPGRRQRGPMHGCAGCDMFALWEFSIHATSRGLSMYLVRIVLRFCGEDVRSDV